jgi:hypothetical protein
MLVLAAAVLTLQAKPVFNRDLDWALTKKFVAVAEKRGWKSTKRLASPGDAIYERFLLGKQELAVNVIYEKSNAQAARDLKGFRSSAAVMTAIGEPTMYSTGLEIEVGAFGNKRMSSTQEYAASGMRLSGIVNRSVIYLDLSPPNAGNPTKPATEVYGDVVFLAKYLAHELQNR